MPRSVHSPDTATGKILGETSRYIERYAKRRRRLVTGAYALLGAGLASSMYWADVRANKAEEDNAELSISVISEALDPANDDSAVIFLDGFGSNDSRFLARKLGDGVRQIVDGEVWSLNYNNADISRADIYNTIVDFAEERGIESISLAGYSAGGVMSIEAASDIVSQTDIDVEAVISISTPSGYEQLQPLRQDEVDFAMQLVKVPGAEYSTLVRYVGEMFFLSDRFTDDRQPFSDNLGAFFEALGFAAERVGSPKVADTWLMIDQLETINNADLEDEFQTIGDSRGDKLMPAIIYIGTEDPSVDYMVNDNESSENICSYAMNASLSCRVYNVPNAIHTRYDLTVDEYNQTFANAQPAIQAILEREVALRALAQYLLNSEY